ncbi:hypothetical protein LY78DRAFT_4186 [Colletotrichum sublineola]|nr:hypothetical protein LY78DRAFT_4186 [Colletotrichum sublineola]
MPSRPQLTLSGAMAPLCQRLSLPQGACRGGAAPKMRHSSPLNGPALSPSHILCAFRVPAQLPYPPDSGGLAQLDRRGLVGALDTTPVCMSIIRARSHVRRFQGIGLCHGRGINAAGTLCRPLACRWRRLLPEESKGLQKKR